MKKVFIVITALCLCLCLSGCTFFATDTDSMLKPPKLTGEMYIIEQALNKSVDGDYTLKYPTVGENRSAVLADDIDGDGVTEAFAFYTTSDGETTMMHINALTLGENSAKSVDEESIEASGIEQVELCDLDGDGKKEIVVGFNIYANAEKKVAVYSFKENVLNVRMAENYTNFICCDLDGDKQNEIFIQKLSTKDSENSGSLYKIKKDGAYCVSACPMDSNVKTAGLLRLSSLSTGQTAIYTDEIKGIGAITEVLFFNMGELVNPLLDTETTLENNKTLRSSNISVADINGDGILEIPVASEMPNAKADTAEKLYYTNWCAFNGESLTVKTVSLLNLIDGYYLNIPERWQNSIAGYKDTDKRTRTIYSYNAETGELGDKILTVKATELKDKKDKKDKSGEFLLSVNNGTEYTAIIGNCKGPMKVKEKEVKKMFNLYSFT